MLKEDPVVIQEPDEHRLQLRHLRPADFANVHLMMEEVYGNYTDPLPEDVYRARLA